MAKFVACLAECNEIGPDEPEVWSLVDGDDVVDFGARGHQTASLAVLAEWGVFTHTLTQKPPAVVVGPFLIGSTWIARMTDPRVVHFLALCTDSICHWWHPIPSPGTPFRGPHTHN